MDKTKRREFMAATLGGMAAAGGVAHAAAAKAENEGERRVLRFAHFTDIHIGSEGNTLGLAAGLRHMQALGDRPEMLINGGDIVWDAMGATEERANEQYALVEKVLKKECHIPIKHCLGNHDVWGHYKKDSKTTGNERLWGKKLPMAVLGMDKRYYSFDHGNWHFLVLDSVYLTEGYYKGGLDEEQFEWLEKELAAAKDKHVVVVSHIPIFSAAACFFNHNAEENGYWEVQGRLMHLDARRLTNLFAKHPNVKLCISGHLHMVDRVEYKGTTYICAGAVSGNYWKGSHHGFSEGYGVFDLFADGTFEHEYTSYGWKA